jgi:hypothetical protein
MKVTLIDQVNARVIRTLYDCTMIPRVGEYTQVDDIEYNVSNVLWSGGLDKVGISLTREGITGGY